MKQYQFGVPTNRFDKMGCCKNMFLFVFRLVGKTVHVFVCVQIGLISISKSKLYVLLSQHRGECLG